LLLYTALANRDGEAIKLYKDLIDHPTTSVPKVTAEFQLADAYQSRQPEEAKRIYDELAKEKDPNIAQLARQKQAGAIRSLTRLCHIRADTCSTGKGAALCI
jgi:hypothetical protein